MIGFIAQALKLDDFLQSTLAGIDSRPVYAGVNGYKKKRYNCLNKKACSCGATYSAPDATVGCQRNKVNQNKYFIGYRKHSIVCQTPEGLVVLMSMVLPNDTHDINVLIPLVEKLKTLEVSCGLKIEYLVGDLGYLSNEKRKTSLHDHDVAVVTGFKENTVIPENCSSKGIPECEQGYVLIWDGFDKNRFTSWFIADSTKCNECPLQGSCLQQWEFSFDEDPLFYGPVPQGSKLQEEMLNFRKQVELAFAIESNKLDSVMRHKKLPVRTKERVGTFFIMIDIF